MLSLNLTPHASAAHWSAAYVGLLWAQRLTCWVLTQRVQRERFGRALPDFTPGEPEHQGERAAELQQAIAASPWRPVAGDVQAQAREGDVLMMRGEHGPHIGTIVMLRGPAVLHLVGGQREDGGVWGSSRVDDFAALARLRYGHLRLWRAA